MRTQAQRMAGLYKVAEHEYKNAPLGSIRLRLAWYRMETIRENASDLGLVSELAEELSR